MNENNSLELLLNNTVEKIIYNLDADEVDEALHLLSERSEHRSMLRARLVNLVTRYGKVGYFARVEAIAKFLLRVDSEDNVARIMLANAYNSTSRWFDALPLYQLALKINPTDGVTRFNYACALQGEGRIADSITELEAAVRLNPRIPGAAKTLAMLWLRQGQQYEALNALQRHLEQACDDRDTLALQAEIYRALGLHMEASLSYRRVVELAPNDTQIRANYGYLLTQAGLYLQARVEYQFILQQDPGNTRANLLMGVLCESENKLWEAIDFYHRALSRDPSDCEVLTHCGSALLKRGAVKEAGDILREVIKQRPHDQIAWSGYLCSLNYLSDISCEEIALQHQLWRNTLPQPNSMLVPLRRNSNPNRRLRIGYLSPDFRNHSVAFFFEPLLRHHCRDYFEVYCYSLTTLPDSITDRFRLLADQWRDIHALDDDKIMKVIQSDEVDILVDLAGHTANNRIRVFTRRLAPIQITYLGYPNTTGLSTMDYRITDAIADPPGAQSYYSETLWRLQRGFLCFQPDPNSPDIQPPPPQRPEKIIGCFNAFQKITTPCVEAWATILRQVPEATLLVKCAALNDMEVQKQFIQTMAVYGIDKERLKLRIWTANAFDHLSLYNSLDLALDTFPYNGTTTTCEALWMGVPVVSWSDKSHRSRVGASILSQVGLTDLVAYFQDEYVSKTVSLLRRGSVRSDFARGARNAIKNLPLGDGAQFVPMLEAAFREMWQRWCGSR